MLLWRALHGCMPADADCAPQKNIFQWQAQDSALYFWRYTLSTCFIFAVFPILCNDKVARTCTPIVTHLRPLRVMNDSMSTSTVFLLIKGHESIAYV